MYGLWGGIFYGKLVRRMKVLNPEGSLKIDTGVDRDWELEMLIENPKPDTSQSVYIDRTTAVKIIEHFNEVFKLGYIREK